MSRSSDSPVTYLLRDPKATKATPIICAVRFENQRLNFGSGFKVLPIHWNGKTSRVKNIVDAIDKQQINDWLKDTDEAIGGIIADMKSNRQALTKESVKARIDAYLKPVVEVAKPEPTEPALFTFISKFITAAPTRVNIETGKHVERRTIQKYETVLKVLREFAIIYRRKVDFDTIDLDFYDAFNAYLTATKGFATNNVGKYLQTLKVFLNDASARGIQVKQDYRSRKFKVVKEDADNVYLSEAELLRLQEIDLSKSERLERVRDLFLVGCYTGLRFSDLTNLRPEYIKDGLIRIEQQKTADKVVIPCYDIVTAMLAKYGGTLPRSISNQKMNDYLKEVCQLAGINSIESKAQTKGGKRVTKSFEKWEMVSTHTARRSFATNMYLIGIPAMTIMQITGHRTEKAFMKYIKLDREQHAKVMALHWQKQVTAASPFKSA
ncbi:site-specific integrase [Fibrivirga algicola]|uniref:Site-specific integrase n=1 Tax=Fibrivirga algicola TaxID=2950420 RepID=A0ABX0QI84_9BACT|nr:site-specific integrase [Fibrivirga algicola]NID11543.1 site-specific integrase [Fibrivirga algicola]